MRNERALILIFLGFFFALLAKDGCMGRVLGSVAKPYSCLLCFDGSCPQVQRFLSVFGQTTCRIWIFFTPFASKGVKIWVTVQRVTDTTSVWFNVGKRY